MKLINSFKNAFRGLFLAFKDEQNMKIHGLFVFLVVLFGFICNISITEWFACLILFGLVISFEIINTAIENLVDLVTKEHKALAGKVKDISAGAVLFSAIIAFIIGVIIFAPKVIKLL